MKRLLLSLVLYIGGAATIMACTNIIVGKKASKDGSVFVSYNADSYGAYGIMQHFPAAKHAKGDMRIVRDWETNRLLGQIEEAKETYNVVGNMNEHQLCITETTFGGREELVDTAGLIDYGSLIYITLQRARTAREAIKVMDALVQRYGYCSEGETFSIADPNEAFIMEMVGKGSGAKGAVWVAVRIPDDAICAHANQSRIGQFLKMKDDEVIYSKDVISTARRLKLFDGKDEDFSFAAAYCPINFANARICEARVWSVFNLMADGMDKYLPYASGEDLNAAPLPLYVRPNRKLDITDVYAGMRDHFDNTPLNMVSDAGAGTWLSPYRPRPLYWEHDGKKYFNERPVGTQQSSFAMVAQLRSSLPNAIGGVLWFSNDDAHTTPYTPVYCCATKVPDCYTLKWGNAVKFSWKSAYWVQNWVSNMVYPRYSQLMPAVKIARDGMDSLFLSRQSDIEKAALTLYNQNKQKAVAYLTDYSLKCADTMMTRWRELGEYLIVKYNDMVERVDDGRGSFEVSSSGQDTIMAKVLSPGYPAAVKKKIAEETGSKYLLK